jgi:hypothetical protein
MRMNGRGGLAQILEARARGEHVPIPRDPADATDPSAPRLAGSSVAWAFRIDVEVGAVARSWWCVYGRSEPDWECRQRLVIVE